MYPEDGSLGRIDELRCGFCGHTTYWPTENDTEMMIYGLGHVSKECGNAPVEMRAEAIVTMEALRLGEDI